MCACVCMRACSSLFVFFHARTHANLRPHACHACTRTHTHVHRAQHTHTGVCVPLDTSPRVGPGCRADLTEIFKSQFCPQNMLPACRSQESRLWESCTDPVNEALIKKIAVPKFQQGVAVRQKLVVQLGRRCCRLAQERLHLFREPLHQFL